MVIVKFGDLLQAKEVDIIAHQVNCVGSYGAGIAKQIARKYPQAKNDYLNVCNSANNPKDLLGTYHITETNDFLIAGLFGQLYYGKYGDFYRLYKRQTDYNAFKKALQSLKNDYPGYQIAMPYGIGCGLAKGNWKIVYLIIEDVFKDKTIYLYKLNGKS